eukprot:1924960-Rhodomonas_salina.1
MDVSFPFPFVLSPRLSLPAITCSSLSSRASTPPPLLLPPLYAPPSALCAAGTTSSVSTFPQLYLSQYLRSTHTVIRTTHIPSFVLHTTRHLYHTHPHSYHIRRVIRTTLRVSRTTQSNGPPGQPPIAVPHNSTSMTSSWYWSLYWTWISTCGGGAVRRTWDTRGSNGPTCGRR